MCESPCVWSSRSSGTSGLPLHAAPFPPEHTASLQAVGRYTLLAGLFCYTNDHGMCRLAIKPDYSNMLRL